MEEIYQTIETLIKHSQKCRPEETGHGVVVALARLIKLQLEEKLKDGTIQVHKSG